MTKWPNERLVKTRVVSGYIFLRLLCPAILNPRQFNLLSGIYKRICLFHNFVHIAEIELLRLGISFRLARPCQCHLFIYLFFSEPPAPAATRSLVMIAKCLQNLANLVEFGVKESYMEVVNPFILKNKERMVVFLDHLSVSIKRISVCF